jgi:hypothetical protein
MMTMLFTACSPGEVGRKSTDCFVRRTRPTGGFALFFLAEDTTDGKRSTVIATPYQL